MKNLIFIYSIGGVIAIFSSAIYRLYPHVQESISYEFSTLNWIVLAVYLLVMIVGKGYFALHRGFVPRVINRSGLLVEDGKLIDKLLAPLYCMGFFKAPMKRMIISYVMIFFIVSFIVSASKISQPWRGIIDMGVIVGLSLGILSLLFLGFNKLKAK